MAHEVSKFKVGLFLIGGFLLLNALVIWIGATRLFEERVTYTSYFEESVQGLDVGSSVKYRGVSVGNVSAIRVAPDGRLVEVRLDLDPSFQVRPEMRARLAITGITGGTFVEIGFPDPEAELPPPELSFPPPANYLPSQRSFLTNLMTALSDVAHDLQGADLPGLVREYRRLASDLRGMLGGAGGGDPLASIQGAAAAVERAARGLESLVRDPRVDRTLDRVDSAAAGLDRAATAAARYAEDPRVEETLAQLHDASRSMRGLAARLEREVSALHTGERLDQVQAHLEAMLRRTTDTLEATGEGATDVTREAAALAKRAEGTLRQLEQGLRQVLMELSKAAARVESLAASLEENPARLLQEPPKEVFP